MRITCASFERSEPRGSSWSSVSDVTAGRALPSVRSIGAAIGGPASTDAATADCQSPRSTSTTAVGRSASEVEGKRALATPAASAAASPPATRMVLRVAVYGKPSFSAACSSSLEAPGPAGLGIVVAEVASGERESCYGEYGQGPAHGAADDS